MRIGAFAYAGIYTNGSIDEVGFWKRVLTADERTWLYNSGAGRTYSEADASLKTNLVSWWSMNAPASGNWLDQHGSNHLTPSASRPTATEGVTFNAASEGDTVRRWLDRSGNGRHLDQATLANQPTFSGGVLSFNNAASNVMTQTNGFSSKTLIAVVSISTGYSTLAGLCGDTTADGSLRLNAGSFRTDTSGSDYPAGKLCEVNASGATLFSENTRLIVCATSNAAGFLSGLQWNIGGGYIGRFWKGTVCELLHSTNELDYATIAKVRKYLARKWGVAI
jgi:hypothetical protein